MTNYVPHGHIQKKDANDMTCQYTHYQNITCLTLLSWPIVSTMKNMSSIPISKYMYGAAYNIHAPTPPKSFHPNMKKYTNGKQENIGVQKDNEMSIQNTEKKKMKEYVV